MWNDFSFYSIKRHSSPFKQAPSLIRIYLGWLTFTDEVMYLSYLLCLDTFTDLLPHILMHHPVFIQKLQRKAAKWNTSLPRIKLLPWIWTLLIAFGIMSTRKAKLFLRYFTVEMLHIISAIVLLASPFFHFCTFCLSTLTNFFFFRSLLGFSLDVFSEDLNKVNEYYFEKQWNQFSGQ